MEGGVEAVATGVGATGVGENGVDVEVVVIGGVPDGWIEQQSRNARRWSPRKTQERTGVGSSVSPVRKKPRLGRRQASPNCFEALSPTVLRQVKVLMKEMWDLRFTWSLLWVHEGVKGSHRIRGLLLRVWMR